MINILSSSLLETLILLLSVLFLVKIYINKKWKVLKNLNIPHEPPSVLGLGNLSELVKDPDSIFSGDLKNKKKFGKIYGAYMGLTPQVTINDPEILRHVFIKQFSSFSDRNNIFRKINGKELNNGLNVVSGQQWKRLRNTLSPSFSSSKLKGMFEIMQQCADATVIRLQKAVQENDGRFNGKEIFSRLSLDVICSTAFSTNVLAQENKDGKPPKIVEMAHKSFEFSLNAASKPMFMLIFMFPWIENILALFNYSIFPSDSLNYFSKLVDVLINRKATESGSIDLMQLMLQAKVSEAQVQEGVKKGLTKIEIIGNSMIMMLAGYETTGNAMLFLAYNLATHKSIQERVKKEIECNKVKGQLTYEAVNNMKYLTMCINESLRLYGLLPRNSRICGKDIEIDGIRIPKGMKVIAPVYGFSHDTEYWDEPFVFNPDRMEDMSKIDPIIFQPFGVGPRNCIGMRLATLEIKIAFCHLLSNFELDVCTDTPKPPLELSFKANMKPKETIFLQVVPREIHVQ